MTDLQKVRVFIKACYKITKISDGIISDGGKEKSMFDKNFLVIYRLVKEKFVPLQQ